MLATIFNLGIVDASVGNSSNSKNSNSSYCISSHSSGSNSNSRGRVAKVAVVVVIGGEEGWVRAIVELVVLVGGAVAVTSVAVVVELVVLDVLLHKNDVEVREL